MIIVAIETSCRIGSVALCDQGQLLVSYAFPEGVRHARDIMPALDSVVSEAALERSDVDAVAASVGPGSFTGLRVGVTCAKALAYGLGWDIVGVPSLEVQVQNLEPAPGRWACPVLDARREHVYGTVFRWEAGSWRDSTGVLIRTPADLANAIPPGACVFGTGVEAYPEVFAADRFEVCDPAFGTGRAEVVARVGLRMLNQGHRDDPMTLVPQYYRLTQAEERLEAGEPK
jgi:tRNA threonylcarbamoyladenosine biosynthesis protein TsaB